MNTLPAGHTKKIRHAGAQCPKIDLAMKKYLVVTK